jgi:AcrR family transcriptional regulator
MNATRAYRASTRPERSEQTRERITAAVRELLAEGSFHTSSVEEVAKRAHVSRATVYQHFRSRVDLVDPICDTFDRNPALVRLREIVTLEDPAAALAQTIALSMRFWDAEDSVLRQLYGVVAIDPAAQELVRRQREDRRGEIRRLARHLRTHHRLRTGVSQREATDTLMVLTSYETYRELREAGRSAAQLTKLLQGQGRRLLLA